MPSLSNTYRHAGLDLADAAGCASNEGSVCCGRTFVQDTRLIERSTNAKASGHRHEPGGL